MQEQNDGRRRAAALIAGARKAILPARALSIAVLGAVSNAALAARHADAARTSTAGAREIGRTILDGPGPDEITAKR